jgi:UDP-glucose 4-epimerase
MILVTGASGFVGRAVCARLASGGHAIRAVVRHDSADTRAALPGISLLPLGDLTASPDWRSACDAITTVIHLAARTHVVHDRAADPEAAYRRINVDATSALLAAAGAAGVERVIYLSSIKVNGEATAGTPFTGADVPAPLDAYGRTKRAAEDLVRAWATDGRRAIILRPPLVYGAGARGNLLRLLRWVDRGIPLPFGAIRNRRSLINLDNLATAIASAVTEAATPGTYTIADAEPVSTPALIHALGAALGRPPRLISVPPSWLSIAAAMTGRQEVVRRLTGSLEVDSRAAQRGLGWTPAALLRDGLGAMARAYRTSSP